MLYSAIPVTRSLDDVQHDGLLVVSEPIVIINSLDQVLSTRQPDLSVLQLFLQLTFFVLNLLLQFFNAPVVLRHGVLVFLDSRAAASIYLQFYFRNFRANLGRVGTSRGGGTRRVGLSRLAQLWYGGLILAYSYLRFSNSVYTRI